jgi:hypothetical protein
MGDNKGRCSSAARPAGAEEIEGDMDTADQGGLVLDADSRLIEDFLHTSEVFVDATKPAPLTVFTNANGETEALALSSDGEIHHVAREPASDSGWNVYGLGAAFVSISAGSDALWAVGRTTAGCGGSAAGVGRGRLSRAGSGPGR